MSLWFGVVLLVVTVTAVTDEIDHLCADKSPYCNTNDCTVRPGYAMEYCRRTCGSCEPFCYNSHYVPCSDSRKPECDSMLKDYCPLLCGVCRPIKKKYDKTFSATPRKPPSFSSLLKSAIVLPTNRLPTNMIPSTTVPRNPAEPSFSTGNSASSESRRSPSKPILVPLDHPKSTEILSSIDEYDDNIEPDSLTEPHLGPNASHSNFVFPPTEVELPAQPPAGFRSRSSLWLSSTKGAQSRTSPKRQSLPYFLSHNSRLQYASTDGPPGPDVYAHPAVPSPYTPYATRHHGAMEFAEEPPLYFVDLITLLGCRDKDPATCSKLTVESCLSRPGFYMKLCPVKCKNCNGLQCLDSVKIDCAEVRRLGGCKLPTAAEYCPRSCRLCATPSALAAILGSTASALDSLPPCKDELETCEDLAMSGVCEHEYSKNTMRIYCAKTCGFCREPQYYVNDVYRKQSKSSKSTRPKEYGG